MTDSGGTGVSFGACTFLGIGTRTWRVSKDGIGMKPDLWCYQNIGENLVE